MGHGGNGAIDAEGAAFDGGGLPLDRSKVHVLLCDKDPKTAGHVMNLLQACSYQVTVVKSAGQVMGVLDSCSYEVDLILSEVELPKEKGFKMLKHIVRQEQLRRIPVVMMSVRDEMAVIVKCLRLGAVDYLLKPLRTNELLNLWTHMWRRRRMLGLTEKHFVNGKLKVPFDLLVSETSESNNTNSTNLFSDDTGDCKGVIISMQGAKNGPAFRDMESEMSPHQLELSLKPSLDLVAEDAKDHCTRAGMIPPPPKKSNLKLGQSSAFLTYVRASNQSSEVLAKPQSDPEAGSHTPDPTSNLQSICHCNDDSRLEVGAQEHLGFPMQHDISSGGLTYPWDSTESSCRSISESREADGIENPSTSWNHPPLPVSSSVQFPLMHLCDPTESCPGLHAPPSLVSPSIQFYHGEPRDEETNIAPGMPVMHAVPPNHGLPLTPAFSYYPLGLHIAAPQLGPFPGWATVVATPGIERKVFQAERREAAVNKFRLKRKDRCFNKKIRYVSRKRLAEQRPRIRGQFVRRENETHTNENGILDDYDDEEEDEQDPIDLGVGSPAESNGKDAFSIL